ncbi:MAG: hypothetical protein IH944_02125 [Armatimonadetes bacterium]|nr:hypothetical protein [Armatimonadota bacterium]
MKLIPLLALNVGALIGYRAAVSADGKVGQYLGIGVLAGLAAIFWAVETL